MKSAYSLLILFLFFVATVATAETFIVDKEADDNGACTPGDCSFREAILAANANPGFDTIRVPAGTYPVEISGTGLDEGSFDVLGTVEILGEPGQTFLVGDGRAPVLFLAADDGPVTLVGLDISGGYNVQSGGGIRSSVTDLVVEDCSIHGNYSESDGGGIASLGSDLTMSGSVVFDNEAGQDGGGVFQIGVFVTNPELAVIENSTISGNRAFQGGGVGVVFDSVIHLRNTTIVDNEASFRASAFYTDGSPPARLINTIFVGRCSQNLPPESGGGNIESPGETCFLDDPTDRMGVEDPGLGPLGDYGGPTWTHALLAGSPAIDTGAGSCEPTDQRGIDRPVDGDGDGVAICDVGAFEFLPEPSVVEVPVASRFGRMALAALLALIGWGTIRQRL